MIVTNNGMFCDQDLSLATLFLIRTSPLAYRNHIKGGESVAQPQSSNRSWLDL